MWRSRWPSRWAIILVTGGVTNALNMPSLCAEEAPKLKPYMALAEKLGSAWSASWHMAILPKIAIEVEGAAAAAQQQADHRRGAGRLDAAVIRTR